MKSSRTSGHQSTPVSTATAALCPCRSFLSPPIPLVQGCWESLPLLKVSGCAAPATGPLLSFLPPDKRLECTAAGLLRQGQALQASVRADRSRRPCTCRETGGAHACLTRRWRALADHVGPTCPHTPRESLRSAVGRMV